MKNVYEKEKELLTKIPPEQEYEKQTLKNDFIFGKVMQDKTLCIKLLELLTGNVIDDLISINIQKAIKVTSESKEIRYDVYVEDCDNNAYDTEMQNLNTLEDLPKRTRYYQGMMDLNLLESGGSYNDLKNSYVLFICTFDPFGENLCCYEFKNMCIKDTNISLKDGRKILFFNTKGKIINVSKQTKEFLDYLETKNVASNFTKQLDIAVEKARQNKEWRIEYMKNWIHDIDVREEGIRIGREEGREEGIKIFVASCKELGIDNDTIKQKLIEKFELSIEQSEIYINS